MRGARSGRGRASTCASRRILVIGTMIALGRWEELRMHVRAALAEGGLSVDELKEIILQQAIYCGVPAAHHALAELSAVVAEHGLGSTDAPSAMPHHTTDDGCRLAYALSGPEPAPPWCCPTRLAPTGAVGGPDRRAARASACSPTTPAATATVGRARGRVHRWRGSAATSCR